MQALNPSADGQTITRHPGRTEAAVPKSIAGPTRCSTSVTQETA